MWFGIFLMALGILYLLRNLGILCGDIWDWAWPILIICIGIGIILKPICGTKSKHPVNSKISGNREH